MQAERKESSSDEESEAPARIPASGSELSASFGLNKAAADVAEAPKEAEVAYFGLCLLSPSIRTFNKCEDPASTDGLRRMRRPRATWAPFGWHN